MDAAILGDRQPEGTQKPLLSPGSSSLQCRHWESSTVLAGLAFCEMLSQYPRSAFQGLCGGHQRGSAAVCDPNPPRPFARSRALESVSVEVAKGDSQTFKFIGAGFWERDECRWFHFLVSNSFRNHHSPCPLSADVLASEELGCVEGKGPEWLHLVGTSRPLDWGVSGCLKNSISIENFNPDLQNSPQQIGVCWVARLKFSISQFQFRRAISNAFKLWALTAQNVGPHFHLSPECLLDSWRLFFVFVWTCSRVRNCG